jgi:hypothetical protein
MASYYSILQYVGDPVKDERINVGVFAFDQSRCKLVHTDDWSHLRCMFGSQSVRVVKDALRELRHWNGQEVRTFAANPYGNFNVTEPSASMLSPEELLLYISRRVLTTKSAKASGYTVKSELLSDVRRQFRSKLIDRFGPGGIALLRDRKRLIFSTKVPINPDIAVGNGEVQSVVQALSFEERDEGKVQRDASATGFIIRSIREANGPISDAHIGIVCLPPKNGTTEMNRYYELAIADFTKRNAALLDEKQFGDWATAQVAGLHVQI